MVFERKNSEGEPIEGWWFRDKKDRLIGPFTSRGAAEIGYELDRRPTMGDFSMNYPVYEREGAWWFRDDEFDTEYGPFTTREDAIGAYEDTVGFPPDEDDQ